jgi:hypothetical protein
MIDFFLSESSILMVFSGAGSMPSRRAKEKIPVDHRKDEGLPEKEV